MTSLNKVAIGPQDTDEMKQLKLILLLFIMAVSANAQRLHIDARIIDAKTGERLPFASVYISGQNSTISNAEGEFGAGGVAQFRR